jgi:flagellar M-ring protein FliF
VTYKSAPRNAAELQKIQQIVAAAVGYDQSRGDLLTVENIAFDEHVVEVGEPGFIERYGTDLKNTGKWIGVFLMCVMVLMFVIRPIVRDTLRTLPAARAPELSASQGLPGQLPRTIEEVEGEIEAQLDAAVAARISDRKMPVLQRRVVTMAQAEPQNAARLLRSWLAEQGRS